LAALFIVLPVLIGVSTGSLSAQFATPLLGPLIATTPARQDVILIHDLGGEQRRELSFGYGEHHVWGFSPDGCRILFTLDEQRGGPPKMFTARLDGSDQRAMVQYGELPPDDWGVWEPTWSSRREDGSSRIAFTMIRKQPALRGEIETLYHIGWVNSEGGEPGFYSVTGREFTPQWSPNGEWLAYVSYDERVAGADLFSTAEPTVEPLPGQPTAEPVLLQEADMWVVSYDGLTKYRLTNFRVGSMRSPRWSPDSELIGFIYSPSPFNDMFWMIANREGAIPTQLSNMWNTTLDHTWLPDSSAMLASVRDFRGIAENRLWRIPLIGNADDSATLYLEDIAFLHTDYPRFSPDSRYLAFRSYYNVIVLYLSDNTWRRLDEDLPGNTPPYWSPTAFDGEQNCPA
jgi:Tol biopolymer transport system component